MNFRNPLMFAVAGFLAVPSIAGAFSPANTAAPRDLPPAESSHDSAPPAPNPISGQSFGVVSQAGIGSNVSYARSGVVERGGGLSWMADKSMNRLAITPQAGWFVTDNIELSTLMQWELEGTKTRQLTFLVEPSLHLPLADQVFAFVGAGVGLAYKSQDTLGFALAPRAGFNVLVGRSGVLTPSVTFSTSTNRAEAQDSDKALLAVNSRWNVNLGYSVMW